METQALYETYAKQIREVEMKALYESFLLLALEMDEGDFKESLKELNITKLRAEVSRQAAKKVLSQFVETLGSKEQANFIFVRAYGVLLYLYSLKGDEFLEFANSLPEYVFEICAEIEMVWKGEGDYGFFEFDPIALQKAIDTEVGSENADPLGS
ncbi:MAG: hypothetical protein AAF212_10425 [Verrucomicrobiota bacterium]